jgi:hypothetical protein
VVFIALGPSNAAPPVLVGVPVDGARPAWRLPLPASADTRRVALAPAGNRAAVWDDGSNAVRIVSLPDGALLADLALEHPRLGGHVRPFFDVAFSSDGNSIVAGRAGWRARFSVSDPAAAPMPEAGFGEAGACDGMTGQSNIGRVHSRDQKLLVRVSASNAYRSLKGLDQQRCGAGVLLDLDRSGTLPAQHGTMFMSFAPDDRRLAVVYHLSEQNGGRSVVEIRDTGERTGAARLLTRLVVDGMVGYRVGWSADSKRLAVLRTTTAGSEARVYAVP